MSLKDCNCYQVFIASPSDCGRERILAHRAILYWNAKYAAETRRILLPRWWETDMSRMGSLGGLQEVINEDLVQAADLLIVFFRQTLGASHGTVREIERFIDLDRAERIMIYALNGGLDAEDELREYLAATVKPILRITPYRSARDIPEMLEQYLWKRVGATLAATSIEDLRVSLQALTKQWFALRGATHDGTRAYVVLTKVNQAFVLFRSRSTGRAHALLDDRVRHIGRQIVGLAPSAEAFIEALPMEDADDTMTLVSQLLRDLPDEDDLL